MNFTGFISAVLNHWVSIMSGIGSIFFAVIGLYKKTDLQRKIFWIMALFCFFLASVSAWTNEHQNVQDLSSQLKIEKENNRPNIILAQKKFMYIGKKNETSLYINLAVKNIGSPSVVTDWRLNVKLPDGTSLNNIMPILIQDGMKIQYKDSNSDKEIKVQFHQNNKLEEKTIVPIQRGDFKAGWLWFQLPKLTREQFKTSIITLYANDILGKEYSMKVDISKDSLNYNDQYIPGSGDDIYKHNN